MCTTIILALSEDCLPLKNRIKAIKSIRIEEVHNRVDLEAITAKIKPEVVVLDYGLPGDGNIIEITRRIPLETRIIMPANPDMGSMMRDKLEENGVEFISSEITDAELEKAIHAGKQVDGNEKFKQIRGKEILRLGEPHPLAGQILKLG